jgi:protein-disulfide isomerase
VGTLKVPVTQHDHVRGPANAPMTLVEYGDYECPHCGLAHPIVNAVQKHFGKKLRFVFRHFPLSQVHPNAEPAAESAEFAGAHDRFWEMHDGIYENQEQLGLPLFFALAEALGLSEAALRDALATGVYAPKVRADFLGGVQRRQRHALVLHQWAATSRLLRIRGTGRGHRDAPSGQSGALTGQHICRLELSDAQHI